MPQFESGYGIGHFVRFVSVYRQGLTALDVAESAVAGADVAEDHESGGAVTPAFAHVGAGSAAAHGMQPVLAVQTINTCPLVTLRQADLKPVRFA